MHEFAPRGERRSIASVGWTSCPSRTSPEPRFSEAPAPSTRGLGLISNLDEVFAAIDRTQSTLGQHALYHRLRTAPYGDHLGAFAALVERMTCDASDRERAQVALARLQDPHGYDIWWLGRANAVERRHWYFVFPILTVCTIASAALAPFWSAAVMPLVALLVLNVLVRYVTDFRIWEVARPFRQCAPLIATAEALQFLAGDDIDPIVGPLRADVPLLARLKVISRWVSGDPFMLTVNTDPLILQLSDLVAAVYEYLNLAFLLDATGVYFAARMRSSVSPPAKRFCSSSSLIVKEERRRTWCWPPHMTGSWSS